MLKRDERAIWRSTLLDAFDWLQHGFGGRHSLEWPPAHAAAARQVHGNTVLTATGQGDCGEGDALVTATPSLWIGVRTADCVPMLMVNTRLRRVAAVHAGWRGTVAEIAARAVAEIGATETAEIGATDTAEIAGSPNDLWVAIGPAIGPCCYEVGPEVAAQFGREQLGPEGRAHLDLRRENIRQLHRAGVPLGQIDGWDAPCTRCGDDFHSFRRDGERAGRMVSAIRLRPSG